MNKNTPRLLVCFALAGLWLTANIPSAAAAEEKRLDLLETQVKDLQSEISRLHNEDDKRHRETDEKMSKYSFIYKSLDRISFGAYGEAFVRWQDSPTGSHTGFDARRLVLLPSFRVTDHIIFNAEIEFEHGGAASAVDGDSKTFEGGNVEIEQLYVDFLLNEHFNWRSLGVDLVPIGYINLFHEPTNFYSTERPELYRELIPSTWMEGSTSIFGKIVDGLNYQFQVSTGLEDNAETQEAGVPVGAINGVSGIREARPSIGEFNQSNNDFGYAARLSYQPSFIPGLAGSTSAYFTRTTPRQPIGNPVVLGDTNIWIVDTELRYRVPKTGLELRGDYVHILFDNAKNLGANNDGNPTNNTGDQMFGFYAEAAYHLDMRSFSKIPGEFVPFYRYSFIDLQTGSYRGSDVNVSTGQGHRQYHTFGGAYFPVPQVVLKLDYAVAMDEQPFGPNANRLQGGIGFFF